jgi:hypothetical protein
MKAYVICASYRDIDGDWIGSMTNNFYLNKENAEKFIEENSGRLSIKEIEIKD